MKEGSEKAGGGEDEAGGDERNAGGGSQQRPRCPGARRPLDDSEWFELFDQHPDIFVAEGSVESRVEPCGNLVVAAPAVKFLRQSVKERGHHEECAVRATKQVSRAGRTRPLELAQQPYPLSERRSLWRGSHGFSGEGPGGSSPGFQRSRQRLDGAERPDKPSGPGGVDVDPHITDTHKGKSKQGNRCGEPAGG